MGKKTILSSGFGLGFYIPALLLEHQLNARQQQAEVVVFENYIVGEKKEKIADSRFDYHKNFALARIAQKMPIDIRDSIDFEAVNGLLDTWEQEGRSEFIALSGHWIYILDMYSERIGIESLNVTLLYVDSELSPSWKGVKKYVPDYQKRYREQYLFDAAEGRALYRLDVTNEPVVPYDSRPYRFTVHGGGWGMGTYLAKVEELEREYALDLSIYHESDFDLSNTNHRYWMVDPTWEAWKKDPVTGKHTFPRIGEIRAGEAPVFTTDNQATHHHLYDNMKQAKGIISKPGGSTLIDSLASATPIIFLDPFGPHEQKNADLWIKLGFGISYDTWKQGGFSLELLQPLHEALASQRTAIPNYVDALFDHKLTR
ncbi:UDP-glucuronosyltransferase [Paenibacillus sp. MMS18-CY102]|nr:UDP-glucuronosyltransferase [Paenibacillus sp. MMS18-CY102]